VLQVQVRHKECQCDVANPRQRRNLLPPPVPILREPVEKDDQGSVRGTCLDNPQGDPLNRNTSFPEGDTVEGGWNLHEEEGVAGSGEAQGMPV